MAIDDDQQHIGRFWTSDSENRVGGVLKLRSGRAPRVELHDELTPGFRPVNDAEDGQWRTLGPANDGPHVESLLLHGEISSSPRAVTLVDCFTYHRRFQLFGEGVSEQFLQARYALFGAHVESQDLKFSGVRVRLSSLAAWANLEGFSGTQSPGAKASLHLDYETPEVPQIKLHNGATLRIVPTIKLPVSVTPDGVSISRSVFVEITGAPSSDWNGIDRSYVRPLRSFLQLCTLRESMVDQVEVQVGGNWIRLVASRIGGNALANQTADSVIRFSDIGIEPLAEWLDCVDDLGPTPAVVSDGITGSQDTIETQLLELTTVAEGLHRSIFPQEDRLTVDQAENVRLIVREAIKSEPSRVQDVVNGRFGYIEEMSYPHRLRAIAKEAAVALPEIAGRINR
ncbi:hypothetical protein ACFFTK_31785, partial [Pseudonocardia petroleophila]